MVFKYRVVESFTLEKILKNVTPKLPSAPLNHILKHPIYMSFKYLRGYWLNCFLGHLKSNLNHPWQNPQPISFVLKEMSFVLTCPLCQLGEETSFTCLHPLFRKLQSTIRPPQSLSSTLNVEVPPQGLIPPQPLLIRPVP